MNEQCFFGFMLPAGLLFAFPALSLVRCQCPHANRVKQETKLFHSGRSMNDSNCSMNTGALIPSVSDEEANKRGLNRGGHP